MPKDRTMDERTAYKGREQGGLIFPDSKIEITLRSGEIRKGYFEIECNGDCEMEGYIYSSSLRMQLETGFVSGRKVAVPYVFNSEGMEEGDVLRGSIMFITNLGEYILPFVVSVSHSILESTMGNIRNLFHFTNLAKSNWEEAVRIFCMPGFIDIMTGQDAQYRNLYIGLRDRGNKNHNLEEFLIGINKKKIIEYRTTEDSIKLTATGEDMTEHLRLIRDGWGYTLLAVKAEGDFIELPHTRITAEDFTDNACELEYIIKADRLHMGKNPGRLVFKHLYGQLHVDITVINGVSDKRLMWGRRRKSVRYSLVRHFIDYRIGILSRDKWLQLTQELVSHRMNIDSDDLENSLYEAYLLISQERYNEAKWILDRKIAPDIEDAPNELYCFYLYLTALYSADEYYTGQINDKISSIYEHDPDNWRIAWIMLQTSDEFRRNPTRAYAFAVRQLERGCYSPLMYVEIIRLLQNIPSLLMHFDVQEMRMLDFAARERLISTELREQIAYQASRLKGYDHRIFRILKSLYDSNPTDDVLQAICTQLIRGDRVDADCFKWYEEGVRRGFGITRLYESYLISADFDKEITIPQEVLIYFSYDNDLPYGQTAYLYAYIVRHKAEIPEIYNSYVSRIERFVVKQLYAERISGDLAYLYMEFVVKGMATADNLRKLSGLLLLHRLEISDPSIVSVAVMDERLDKEVIYPVNSGNALVNLMSNDYTLLLEDSLGNRYYGTKEYITERFFLPRKLLPVVEPYADDSLFFDLYVCDGRSDYIVVTDQNADRYLYLEQNDEVSREFRAAIRLPLVRYYKEADDLVMLDATLKKIGRDDVPYKDRDELLRLLVLRGYADKAYEYAVYYGPESIEPQVLVRLATLKIDRDGLIEDENLTAIVMSAFERGKYNETGLLYLTRFYRGLAKNLRNIWKAASGFYVDTYSICETMIEQTLNTGAYIGEEARILKEYVDGGGGTGLELKYLEYFAEGYFVYDRPADDYFFTEMAKIYENEHSLPTVCMLAFLKHYAYNVRISDISEDIAEHIRRYIHILYVDEGIIMPFMQEFGRISAESAELKKLTVVEYRGMEGSKVTINYFINSENDDNIGYTRDEMKEVYGGIYAKNFLIFFGESLQYYITEEHDSLEELTESGTASRNDADASEYSDRYALVNDIAMATALKDYDTSIRLLEEYKQKEYFTEQLFAMQ